MKLQTRRELDKYLLDAAGTHEAAYYFKSKCHPNDPLWVRYAYGVISLSCSNCGKIVIQIKVDEGF